MIIAVIINSNVLCYWSFKQNYSCVDRIFSGFFCALKQRLRTPCHLMLLFDCFTVFSVCILHSWLQGFLNCCGIFFWDKHMFSSSLNRNRVTLGKTADVWVFTFSWLQEHTDVQSQVAYLHWICLLYNFSFPYIISLQVLRLKFNKEIKRQIPNSDMSTISLCAQVSTRSRQNKKTQSLLSCNRKAQRLPDSVPAVHLQFTEYYFPDNPTVSGTIGL